MAKATAMAAVVAEVELFVVCRHCWCLLVVIVVVIDGLVLLWSCQDVSCLSWIGMFRGGVASAVAGGENRDGVSFDRGHVIGTRAGIKSSHTPKWLTSKRSVKTGGSQNSVCDRYMPVPFTGILSYRFWWGFFIFLLFFLRSKGNLKLGRGAIMVTINAMREDELVVYEVFNI